MLVHIFILFTFKRFMIKLRGTKRSVDKFFVQMHGPVSPVKKTNTAPMKHGGQLTAE